MTELVKLSERELWEANQKAIEDLARFAVLNMELIKSMVLCGLVENLRKVEEEVNKRGITEVQGPLVNLQ